MNYFWTNTIWYVLLGILTLIELIFVMVRVENRKLTIAFYLTLLGIVLHFETIIFIFMDAYAYYPMIIKNPPMPIDDMLMGNLFSQTSVSATALLVAVLNLKYYWFIIFAVMYGIIEELFLSLGIYSHNWYQTWMTVISLPIYFWVAKKMYEKIIRGIKPLFYYGYIYLGLFLPSSATLTHMFFILTRHQDFNATLFPDPVTSRFLIFWVHFHLLSIPIMLIYFLRFNFIWKALVIIALYIIYYIGYKLNLIWIKEGWFLPVSTANIFGMYLSVVILDKLYDSNRKQKHDRKSKIN
ncbi:hypothetical protein [Desulfosporosinus nitroreducens]|uniref:Uncharacterized protein n=1 Tax=Desulfosporosinus nitroreducens TaxID=2018668 RepID=A0ABT8QX08_9FIRM|nr:hypothetical protein [Desulfosporosinus nitroreducens]MDO0825878.1 hypothetical protein [Desulfosporosinus nitroreducens]